MDFEEAAQQLIRALRGPRSQRAFAMRLGYRSNPIANWEAGRRYPTADVVLAAATRIGVDVPDALARFHPEAAHHYADGGPEGVAGWLDALRGQIAIAEVSRTAGLSRHAVARWMKGDTRPRLPDFLRIVEATTGRTADLVALLVDIDEVPTLATRHRQARASRRLAFDAPWTEAILRVLEAHPGLEPPLLAAHLGVEPATAATGLERLLEAGLVRRRSGRWFAMGELTVDTRDAPGAMTELKAHWASIGVQRAQAPRAGDMTSYNVISVSREDLERIRQLHIDYFLAVRAIVAESDPEVAALINVQLLSLEPR